MPHRRVERDIPPALLCRGKVGSVVTRVSGDGCATSVASSDENQADVAGYRAFIDAHGGYRGPIGNDSDEISSACPSQVCA